MAAGKKGRPWSGSAGNDQSLDRGKRMEAAGANAYPGSSCLVASALILAPGGLRGIGERGAG